MSKAEAAYSPLSYHNGTVWPHDNSLIAWGLAKHERWPDAHRIVRSMLDAAGTFGYQLPEVFAGLSRTESPFPIAYPTAARPQAWAAGTPVLLLQLLLGIRPDRSARRSRASRRPSCRPWVGDLRLDRPACVRPHWDVRSRTAMLSSRNVNIALLCPVWFPVPPTGYGGIEWVVSLLADGLVEAGHEVTLFASGDSRTKASLAFVYEIAPSAEIGRSQVEVRHALACFERADEFDVINDHSGPPARGDRRRRRRRRRCIRCTARCSASRGSSTSRSRGSSPRTRLISISMNQRKPHPDLPWLANVPNALDFSLYPAEPQRGEYLLFLGRMSTTRARIARSRSRTRPVCR